MGSVLWNDIWIFTNLKEKAVGDNLSCIGLLWFFCSFCNSGSNKAAPVFRLKDQEVGGEPPSSTSLHWMSSLIFKIRCRLPWFWVHLSLQNLTLNFSCFHVNIIFFFTGQLVYRLLVCWLSLLFLLASLAKVLYIRVCECLRSSLEHNLH